jgi:hypothetical protein
MTVTTARDGDDTETTTTMVIMNWLLLIISEEGGRLKQMTFDNILEMAVRVVLVIQKFSFLFHGIRLYNRGQILSGLTGTKVSFEPGGFM